MSIDVIGVRVLVTGAARGLGLAYAAELARRGAWVAVNDIDETVLAEAAAGLAGAVPVVPLAADITDWEQAADLVARAEERVGPLDVVINNAGVFHVAPAGQETEAQVRRSAEVNLLGTVFVGTHALTRMRARGRGRLVNTTSAAFLGLAGVGTYSAMKGGVVSLSRSWALEVAGSAVDVAVLSPKAYTRMSLVRGVETPDRNLSPERVAPAVVGMVAAPPRSLNGLVLSFDGRELSVVRPPERVPLATDDDAEAIARLVASVGAQAVPWDTPAPQK